MRPPITVLAVTALLSLACLPASAQSNSADPYGWLEDVTGKKQLAWVKEHNARTTAKFTEGADFKALQKRLLTIYDSKERIPGISKAGKYYYNFWRDGSHPRGLWRRTTLAEYRKTKPNWETVLDLDALGKAEKTNWVWSGSNFLQPTYDRCLISLSRGGADAVVVREFDVTTKQFVKDGFTLPEAKSNTGWRDKDTIYVGTNFGKGSMSASGYPITSKLWKRGTPLSAAEPVYAGQPTDMWAGAYRDQTPGFERDFAYRGMTFWTGETYLLRDGQQIKIEKQDDAIASVHRDLLFIQLRSDWKVGEKTYPAGALLVSDFEAYLKGERNLEALFTPTARTTLEGYSPTHNHILLNVMDNVRSRLYLLTRQNGTWKREALPGAPTLSTANAWAIDSDESDDYFMSVSDYLTPDALYYGTAGKGPAQKLKSLPSFFDATGLAVSQFEATSKDGTRVPYFLVAKKNLALNGKNPTLLYGYGGFEVSLAPSYSSGTGAAWLEKGGVYVVANIRGGGEFGPKWHQAALKANRNKAYEDFIAVGEDLIRRKVTTTPHLGIMGGSNGGMLMGNMLTMRPDLFGAIVCMVPLLDMQRYNKLLAGASWVGEYGNPDIPEEWAYLKKYSPYQNVRKGVKYPLTLFTTSTRDDRVHPGHARKMVAKMEAMGYKVLYYENIEGGHGGAADNKQRAFMSALEFTYLWHRLR
jgi:prolyl oligopeptidase